MIRLTVFLHLGFNRICSYFYEQDIIANVFTRVDFWNQHTQTQLNERQKKILNRILEVDPGNFTGGLTTRKYVSIVRVSRAIAFREIADMIDKKILRQLPGKGRSAHYDLVWPEVNNK